MSTTGGARSQQNKKWLVSRPGEGIEHNRSRERCNATTRRDDACRVVITTEGPGRFDETTTTGCAYHEFARVANTKGGKFFKPPASCYPYCELAGVWQPID